MISISEQKKKALSQLKGKWTNPVIMTLLFIAITITASFALSGMTFLITVILTKILSLIIKDTNAVVIIMQSINSVLSVAINLLILIIPLFLGFTSYFLMFSKSQKPDIINLFDGYKKSFGNSILVGFLIGLYTFLWFLLLIIPGIIKAYGYSMTLFIMAEEPDISAAEAIKRSETMMNGYKWNYFLLQLSFIGWILLATFTCGIGYIWLFPYMQTATSHFYLKVKEIYENKDNPNDEPLILEQF